MALTTMLSDMTAAWSAPLPRMVAVTAGTGIAPLTDLLSRSGRGDEAAFAELYDQTCPRLFGLVLRVVRDHALAEYVTQQTYLQVWRQSAQFDPQWGSALAWIMTIGYLAAVERVR